MVFSVSKFQEQSNSTTFKDCVELTQQPTAYSAMDVLGVVPRLTLSSVGVTYADLSTKLVEGQGVITKRKICKMFQMLVRAQREKKWELIICQSSIMERQFRPQKSTCGSLCLSQASYSEDENM